MQQVVGFVYGVAMLRRLVPHIELRERCIKQLTPLLLCEFQRLGNGLYRP